MPTEVTEAPPAPTQDLGRTPTLLETLSTRMDISDAPTTTAKTLPPILDDPDAKKPEKEKEEEIPKKEKDEEQPPKKEDEEKHPKKEDEEAQLQKDSETIADKLFKKRTPKEPKKPAEEKKKPDDEKAKEKPPEEKPRPARRPAPVVDEATITERASAAAASAATRAVTDAMAKSAAKPLPEIEKPIEERLSAEEKKQFVVYKELEQLDPVRYKGVTEKYLKSLNEIADYVKNWTKETPGVKFNADDPEHNDFFERVEPDVDEDDWVDAKASLRARDIAARAVAPVNERMQQMERDRARTALEPFVQQKQAEAVIQLVENFDPAVAASIRKPEGLKEFNEKDPISASILNNAAEMLGMLAAEVVKLHDPNAGVAYSATNAAHKEIADFIMGQETRISKLAPQDKERDGKMFIGRLQYRQLPEEQKLRYWFLEQDDVISLLAQKYALRAKNLRDARVDDFNKTADRLGYKKIDAPNKTPKPEADKVREAAKTKMDSSSPEATSRASVKTTAGTPSTTPNDTASAIVGKLFGHLRSS